MSLGEFDFSTYAEMFPRDVSPIRRAFAMILLVGLILFVSLTIYNLFIAVVISDVKDLKDEVFIQVGIHLQQIIKRNGCRIFIAEHLQHVPALLHPRGDTSQMDFEQNDKD